MTQQPQMQSKAEKPLIKLKKVGKTYHSAAGDFPALKELDAIFFPGEFVSVVGKSGSGKSTLVNMITGIDHPSAGEVLIDGVDIHRMTESQRAAWRGLNLGIIFQFFQLLPNLTLLENVMLPMDFCHKYARAERPNLARNLLAQVGLEHCADSLPAIVSGGEQQRAAIARALANDPPIVVADEPTGNLDSTAAETVYSIFQGLLQRGKTIIMVTHDRSLAGRSQRQLLLSDGELVNPHIASSLQFLSHPRMLWLTHQMQSLELAPGMDLQTALPVAPGLLLITKGALNLDDSDPLHARDEPGFVAGDFISQQDINGSANGLARLKSSNGSKTRILWLPKTSFDHWMEEDPGDHDRISSNSQPAHNPAEDRTRGR